MLFVAINRPELPEAASLADGIEFRLDLFPHLNLEVVKTLLHQAPRPVMFTLRKLSHGGSFQGGEGVREELILKLLELDPAYFDLEWDSRESLLNKIKNVKLILSYHNFEETSDLHPIYRLMTAHPAFGYKIAAMAHSTNDALRMLLFASEHSGICVIPMGAKGAFARAIAFEASARGADVIVLNRTLDRAEKIAESIGCDAGGLEDFPAHYEILINCSPVMPIDPKKIVPKTVAMDVVRTPRDTVFLQEAAHRGCELVYGEEMFLNQAIGQTTFWLDNG